MNIKESVHMYVMYTYIYMVYIYASCVYMSLSRMKIGRRNQRWMRWILLVEVDTV